MAKSNVPINFVDDNLFEEVVYNDNHAYNKSFPSGSAAWIDNVSGESNAALQFICPCGCQSVHCITVDKTKKEDRGWLWNGDAEKPTLTPSIQCTTPCRWHGYLTKGVFVQC